MTSLFCLFHLLTMFFFPESKTTKGKLFPRHPYRTRSQAKIMDEFEERNEELRSDVDQLKQQMT